MRIISYKINNYISTGLYIDNKIYDIPTVLINIMESKYHWKYALSNFDFKAGTIVDWLKDEKCLEKLRRIEDFIISYIDRGDPGILNNAVYHEKELCILPPIPSCSKMIGLGGNSAYFWRYQKDLIPDYPWAYIRPYTSLVGHNQTAIIPKTCTSFRSAVELGVVIGKVVKNANEQEAYESILGYTCVNDMISNHWKDFVLKENPTEKPSFLEYLVASYYGRCTDTFGPVGPYIVTKEEVGDPYNLMMYARLSGVLRDRSYSNGMIIGIEQTISWLSKFMTLEPGTIIHMGTMGIDGFTVYEDQKLTENDYVEVEIEKIGVLRTYIKDLRVG